MDQPSGIVDQLGGPGDLEGDQGVSLWRTARGGGAAGRSPKPFFWQQEGGCVVKSRMGWLRCINNQEGRHWDAERGVEGI